VVRTASFIVAGLLLMGSFLLIGRLFSTQFAEASRVSLWAFAAVWLVVAALNMWLGVTKAGYSVAEELPIFVVVFIVPAAAALLIKWRFL